MSLIVEINNRIAALSPEQQREALELIEKLAAQPREQDAAHEAHDDRPTLKGATAGDGKPSISVEEIEAARREMWSDFYDDDEADS